MTKVEAAALDWWEHKRPISWDLESHLGNPEINTTTPREAALAGAVAEMVRINEQRLRKARK